MKKLSKKKAETKKTCPFCGGDDLRKYGIILTSKARKQRWQCFTCGRVTVKPKEALPLFDRG